MVGPEGGFSNSQGALIEGFSSAIVALGTVEHCQVVEASGHIGMVRPQGGFTNPQGALKEGFGSAIVALVLVEQCQVVEAVGHIWDGQGRGVSKILRAR
jgi:hypothetical protein